MRARIIPALLLAVVAAACTGTTGETTTTDSGPLPTGDTTSTTGAAPTTSTAPDPGYVPEFMDDDCEFEEPLGTSPRCGWLVVPEDRSDPAGNQVRVHVAMFEATGNSPEPDPIVYLEGGPGGHVLDALQFSYTTRFAPLTEDRDLILFDQRGVGLSEPSLDCPEERAVEIEYLDDDVSDEEYLEAATGALIECRDRLLADGVDLSDYNSAANAADVADLRIAMGYDEINLWGISYGTRLALTVMRDHPQGIRSVVLDSTVPVDLDLYPAIPASADRAYGVFFAGCAADPSCAAAYPDLQSDFADVASRLDETPADIVVTDFISGDRYPALLFGDDVYGLLFQSLYAESIIPLLPGFISAAADGDYGGLERLASVFFTNGPFVSTGMYLSVQCNEEYAFSSPDEVVAAVAEYPSVAELFRTAASEFDDCALWGAGTADPIEDEPVTSDIPTLVLAGEYDPITPPEYGMVAAATLTNSSFFEFPGLAHGVSTAADCPTSILLAFVDDPSTPPDGSCIAEMGPPDFFVAGEASVTLVPFESDVFGFTVTGVRPEAWEDSGFGVFTAPGLGDLLILQQTVPSGFFTVDELADQFGDQFELDAGWTGPIAYSDGSRDWSRYEGSAGPLLFDLALHDDGSDVLIVVLVSTDDVRETYLDAVFFPVIEAIRAG